MPKATFANALAAESIMESTPNRKMKTPSSFIVYCREEESDWSLASCDMAFEVETETDAFGHPVTDQASS